MRWLIPPVLWGLCLVAMVAQARWLPLVPLMGTPWHLVGFVPLFLGAFVMLGAAAQFHRRKTNIRPFRKPDMLVTEGMFAYTRNPMYLGLALILLGAALLINDPGALLFVLVFLVVADRWYIRVEEEMALREFGAAYETYRRRVRRWI